MSHPHAHFLEEFKIAMDKMVPMTPPEFVAEAKGLYEQLLADENCTEKQIRQAFAEIGRKEYPYRKAYDELCSSDEEKRLQTVVLDRLDPEVKKKVEEMTKSGVVLEEYVKSNLFEEQLEPDERYQVEQAILLADEVLDKQCDDRAKDRKASYEDLVKKYQGDVERIQGLINELKKLALENPKQTADIEAAVDRLEEGWSITSADPVEEEIQKEIEYWNTVMHEGEE